MTWVCPDRDQQQLAEFTSESGYDGVELRVDEDHRHGLSADSTAEERAAAVELFEEHRVDISAVATSGFFAHSDPDVQEEQIAKARASVELAGNLGAGAMRFFAEGDRR